MRKWVTWYIKQVSVLQIYLCCREQTNRLLIRLSAEEDICHQHHLNHDMAWSSGVNVYDEYIMGGWVCKEGNVIDMKINPQSTPLDTLSIRKRQL